MTNDQRLAPTLHLPPPPEEIGQSCHGHAALLLLFLKMTKFGSKWCFPISLPFPNRGERETDGIISKESARGASTDGIS